MPNCLILFFPIPFPFPNFGNGVFPIMPIPELREWNYPFPFPFPNSQKSFLLTPATRFSFLWRENPFLGVRYGLRPFSSSNSSPFWWRIPQTFLCIKQRVCFKGEPILLKQHPSVQTPLQRACGSENIFAAIKSTPLLSSLRRFKKVIHQY